MSKTNTRKHDDFKFENTVSRRHDDGDDENENESVNVTQKEDSQTRLQKKKDKLFSINLFGTQRTESTERKKTKSKCF